MSKVAQFAKFVAKPGDGPKVVAALEDALIAADAEPGTTVYAIHVALDNEELVLLYELYDSRDAQQAHSGSDATARLRATVADLVEQPIEVTRCTPRKEFGLP